MPSLNGPGDFVISAEVIPVYAGHNAEDLLEVLQAIAKKTCIILKKKLEFIYSADNRNVAL